MVPPSRRVGTPCRVRGWWIWHRQCDDELGRLLDRGRSEIRIGLGSPNRPPSRPPHAPCCGRARLSRSRPIGSGVNFFTVKGHDGTTVTVDVTSSTTYKDQGVTSPSFANVTTGEMVSVEGTTASGIVTATSVFIGFGLAAYSDLGRPPLRRARLSRSRLGRAARPDIFTVKGHDGTTVTVDVTSSTTYKDPGVTSPSFANVTTGEMVRSRARWRPASSPPRASPSASARPWAARSDLGRRLLRSGQLSQSRVGQQGQLLHRERKRRHDRHRRRDFLYDLQGPGSHLAELRQCHHR